MMTSAWSISFVPDECAAGEFSQCFRDVIAITGIPPRFAPAAIRNE